MKIYDCFLFYNEFDLLELRLKELYDHVDHFVLVESDLSFTCHQKPYFFDAFKKRFAKWSAKIIHVKHKSSINNVPWHNEYDQRNAILSGIVDAAPDDIVIVGDADEIINPSKIEILRKNQEYLFFGFVMPKFDFKFNYMREDCAPEIIVMATKSHWIKKFSAQMLRNQKANIKKLPFHIEWQKKPRTVPLHFTIEPNQVKIIEHGGWHFSHLGDNEWLREKAKNTSHQEDVTEEFFQQLDVQKSIQEKKCWNRAWPYRYEIVDLDSYFPSSCKDYPQHCLPNSGISAQDILEQHDAR